MMQSLAQNGNGVAAYIDTLSEAQKVLVDEASSTLFPIAQDVKIQMEFNPASVAEYRAIYEITPVGSGKQMVDESRYAPKTEAPASKAGEYGFLKVRYKLPGESTSKLISAAVANQNTDLDSKASLKRDVNFASAVVGFAQLLKGSKYSGSWSYDDALALAQKNKGDDEYGYRTEFVQLVRKAKVAAAM